MLQPLQQRIVGLLFLFVLYVSGLILVHVTGLPVPGAIVGLLLLIALLCLRKGEFPSVRAAAGFILPLIPLFLIPICVSMVITVPLDRVESWKLIALIALSTVVGVVLTAVITRLLLPVSESVKSPDAAPAEQRSPASP